MNSHVENTAFFLATLLLCVVAGCASDRGSDVKKQDSVVESDSASWLNSIPMSQTLYPGAALSRCESEKAREILSSGLPSLTADHAAEIWDRCQNLYACSPATKKAVKAWYTNTQLGFRVGFAQLSGADKWKDTKGAAGLYVINTDRIYIDTGVANYFELCSLLVHEVTHRYDVSTTNESLRAEFKAYWHQMAFEDELYLRKDEVGDWIKQRVDKKKDSHTVRYRTREQLHDVIVKIYQFKADKSVIDEYPPLPTEAFVQDNVKP